MSGGSQSGIEFDMNQRRKTAYAALKAGHGFNARIDASPL